MSKPIPEQSRRQPQVFISYTHGSDADAGRVRAVVNDLRGLGINCIFDQYVAFAPLDWQSWTLKEIADSDFVLIFCTEAYVRLLEAAEKPGKSKGRDRQEIPQLTLQIYERAPQKLRFIPVVFDSVDKQFIPRPLQSLKYYDLHAPGSFRELVSFLLSNFRKSNPLPDQEGTQQAGKIADSQTIAPPESPGDEHSETEADEYEGADSESKLGPAERSFSSLNKIDFTEGAWAVLEVARRLGQSRPRPLECSVRRLIAALLLWGLGAKRATHSGRWLVREIAHEEEWITHRLGETYSEITSPLNTFSRLLDSNITPSDTMTPALKKTIDMARSLAAESRRGQNDFQIAARHLLGSVVGRTGQRTSVERFLKNIGLNSLNIREKLLAALPTWETGDEPEVWKRVLDPLEVLPQPDGVPVFRSDAVAGPDSIGITREVEAMSSLVSAWSIEPPLSIGLFGEWGSGKSFFMQKMKDRVRQIASEARKSGQGQREFGYYKNIVQVEFNAWHYIEGNLWASLVEHIFSNLRLDGIAGENVDSEEHIRKRLENLLGQVKEKTAEAQQKEKLAELASREAEAKKQQAEAEARKLETEAQTARERAKVAETESRQAGQIAANKQREADDSAQKRESLGIKDVIEGVKGSAEIRNLAQKDLELLGVTKERITTVQGLREMLKEASDTTTVLSEGAKILIEDKGRWWLVAWVAVGPLIAAGLVGITAWLTKQQGQPWLHLVTGTFSTLAAVITGVVGFWKRYSPKLKPIKDAVARLKHKRAELEMKVETARQERAAKAAELDDEARCKREEAAAQAQIAEQKAVEAEEIRRTAKEKREDADRAAQTAQAAREEAEKLRQDAEALLPERRIAAFIQDRAGAKDYRQHLGVPALIRRDFEKLSAMFQTQRIEERKGTDGIHAEARNDLAIVNRIILYIDDLDRCPPDKVVEVLRAIHLLLAFPLFVVVVAVDARWMKRSLRDRFSLMLTSSSVATNGSATEDEDSAFEHMATPDDYLEKIFQVPFWIRPLSGPACKTLVNSLTKDDSDTQDVQTQSDEDKPAITNQTKPGNANPTLDPAGATGSDSTRKSAMTRMPDDPAAAKTFEREDAADQRFNWSHVEARPRSLQLSKEERTYMTELAPIIGRSPRSVKRFINCYRLLKSALDKEELAKVTRDGTFRTTMLLLGIMTGLPEIAPVLLANLRESKAETSPLAWVYRAAKKLELDKWDKWAEVPPMIKKLQEVSSVSSIRPLKAAAEHVDRFSFSPARTVLTD